MATDIQSHSEAFWLTRFAGQKGTSIQVTMERADKTPRSVADNFFNHIALTRQEAQELAVELMLFANNREEESL
tara:strand:- start:1626 stop:1847 length:222 start_codon:yes stop_codon:yes gene_type:complete